MSLSGSELSSEASDPLDVKNDEGWEDVEPDYEPQNIVCLFSDEVFNDVPSMLQHCKDKYNFDLIKTRRELGLDFLRTIKLVNYLRFETQAGHGYQRLPAVSAFDNDKYLKPVIEDDALLYNLDDLDDVPADEDALTPTQQVVELKEQLKRLQAQFAEYQEQVKRSLQDQLPKTDDGPSRPPAKSTTDRSTEDSTNSSADRGRPSAYEANETEYFSSYSYNAIHETMLKDTVRTDAYRDFVYDNKHLFKDKVVLDVGCGTGILSMFCAKAGAKLVIAVDNSEIINRARENVFENGLQDIVKCLHGKVEEVTLPVSKVDIIISEWMGYCLLYEAMVDSVIWARDRYLAHDGLMVPSNTSLRIAPIADPDLVSNHVDFWNEVYGFSMTSMLLGVHDEVLIKCIEPSTLAGPSTPFLEFDLHNTKQTDLTFIKPFSVTINGDHDMLDGWVMWFDMFFLPGRNLSLPAGMTPSESTRNGLVAFTTGPDAKQTHWQQAVLLIDRRRVKTLPLKDGQVITGHVGYQKKDAKSRSLDVEVLWNIKSDGDEERGRQLWTMG